MINIISYPQDFLPIYNNYIYSTQSSFYPNLPANYRAICDVYINDNKVGTQGFRKIPMLVGDPAYT